MKARLAILVAVSALTAAAPALAHHSFAAEFDGQKPFRITGSLVKVEWTNPHIYFYVDVKDESGAIVKWTLSAGSPGALSRRGFKKGDLKFGRHDRRRRVPGEGRIAHDGRAARHAG